MASNLPPPQQKLESAMCHTGGWAYDADRLLFSLTLPFRDSGRCIPFTYSRYPGGSWQYVHTSCQKQCWSGVAVCNGERVPRREYLCVCSVCVCSVCVCIVF